MAQKAHKTAFFLAWRYLFSKKEHNIINVISGISMIGIMVSTAALVVVLSVFNGMSVEKAKEVMLRVAAENPLVLQEPKAPFATLEKFGDSSLNMRLYAWTLPENYWNTLFSLNEEIYNAFRKEGLEIPFNQVDVHIKNEEKPIANS